LLKLDTRDSPKHLLIAKLVDALEAFGADGSSHFDDVLHPIEPVPTPQMG
jgi:hypothetical protein